MKNFLLSENTKFGFEPFDIQHISMIAVTFFLYILAFFFRNKLRNLNESTIKKVRIFMALTIFFNMFIYRVSYMFYGVYDIKIHLSLYFCHIVNYWFVLSLILNKNDFYKIIFGLSWMCSIWTIIFPDLSGGIDCFIFYTSFISHNLLLIFINVIMIVKNIKFNIKDAIHSFAYALGIMVFSNIINYDFGTKYNTPSSLIGRILVVNKLELFIIIFLMAIIGVSLGLFINTLNQKKIRKGACYEN